MTMFQITGHIGAPLCASLDIVLHLLETLPSFPANLAYQSNSPIICGFTPEAYAQPWLGLHSLNLVHTPSFNSCRKAEDILKEAIIHSTSEASTDARSVHSRTASVGSVEVISRDEASGGEDDVLDSANKADVSQGSMSLLDISATDNEDTRKCKVHEIAHKSDIDFTAWKDKLISEGVKGIQERDSMVNDYTDGGKRRPKNPDPLGPPPISYMKERGVFQPLPSMTNSLGLCRFYHADPVSVSMLAPPKSPAMAEHLKGLLFLAKMQQWPYIIVVFQGGPVTPLGLLQELHMQSALACIPIYRSDETKDGHKPHACRVAHSVHVYHPE